MTVQPGTSSTTALKFVVLLGVVSLFADMTYEAARSITGPYLALLGASGTIVGIVAGVAEMVSPNKRGSAYGVFSMQFGVYWFLGSVAMGLLYDVSISLLVAFSVVTQVQAVPLFFMARKHEGRS